MASKKKMSEMAKKSGGYSFHDLRKNSHRDVPYSEVRSVLKKSYGKKASSTARQMFQNLKPNTSEAIPAKGGYYSKK